MTGRIRGRPGHLPARGAGRERGAPPSQTPWNWANVQSLAGRWERARAVGGLRVHLGRRCLLWPFAEFPKKSQMLSFSVQYVSYRVSRAEITFISGASLCLLNSRNT